MTSVGECCNVFVITGYFDEVDFNMLISYAYMRGFLIIGIMSSTADC